MLPKFVVLLGCGIALSGCGGDDGGGASSTSPPGTRSATYHSWMSPEIVDAWEQGWLGQTARIVVVDQFSGLRRITGNLGTGTYELRHGEWVSMQAGMIAPSATIVDYNFNQTSRIALDADLLNVLNLSYGFYSRSDVTWSQQEGSIIDYARSGAAVVVKAAGNDQVAVGTPRGDGSNDYLNTDLIGAEAAIFVGALDRNGTTTDQGSLAWYSNFAGSNVTVQNQFLSVGVLSTQTQLSGTSFAAPIVSGYAAVLGSKFPDASPTEIVNQLLMTARTDTIHNYDVTLHGRGEASISRALAPVSIR
jgi:subtilisin family serine protease